MSFCHLGSCLKSDQGNTNVNLTIDLFKFRNNKYKKPNRNLENNKKVGAKEIKNTNDSL